MNVQHVFYTIDYALSLNGQGYISESDLSKTSLHSGHLTMAPFRSPFVISSQDMDFSFIFVFPLIWKYGWIMTWCVTHRKYKGSLLFVRHKYSQSFWNQHKSMSIPSVCRDMSSRLPLGAGQLSLVRPCEGSWRDCWTLRPFLWTLPTSHCIQAGTYLSASTYLCNTAIYENGFNESDLK